MQKTTALRAILGIGIAGLLFSGYLSTQELFGSCSAGCPIVDPSSTVLGYPACFYGFFMYLAIVIVALLGLQQKRAS